MTGQSSASSSSSRVVLVYFIGGCSYSEVAALRFLGKQRGKTSDTCQTKVITNVLTFWVSSHDLTQLSSIFSRCSGVRLWPEFGIFSNPAKNPASRQNSARAGCYCQMLKIHTSIANIIFCMKIPGVSHRSLFCLHSTDV